jgi:ricin-type beta-trefoil lectin protein
MTSTRSLVLVPFVVLCAAAVAAGCIKKEEPPEEAKPAAPPAPPPEPPRSALKIDANVAYTIVGAGSNKCVQFVGANTDDARGEIRACNGSKAQQFHLQPVAGGYVTVVNALSGKCLEVGKDSLDDSAAVGQLACQGRPAQQWIVADGVGDTVRLVARHSGKVLDIADEAKTDGALMGQYPWHSAPNQQFRLKPVADATGAPGGAPKEGAGGAPGKDAGKPHKGAKDAKPAAKPKSAG